MCGNDTHAETFTGAVRAMAAVQDTWNVSPNFYRLIYSLVRQREIPEGCQYCQITELHPFLKEFEFYRVQLLWTVFLLLQIRVPTSPFVSSRYSSNSSKLCTNLVRLFLLLQITWFELTQLFLHNTTPCHIVTQSETKLDPIFRVFNRRARYCLYKFL